MYTPEFQVIRISRDLFPQAFLVLGGPGHLEVVHVDRQEQLTRPVEVDVRPVAELLEAHLQNYVAAVPFPIIAGIWMPV